MTSVSVIIPVYNRPRLLRRALASVAAQKLAPAEIIVVDDGSTERLELPDALGEIPLRLRRHDVNRGGGAARNTGIDAAQGEWVAFLDSDDEWLPHKLETQLALAADLGWPSNLLLCANTLVRKEGVPDRPYNLGAPTLPLCVWLLAGRGTLQTSTLMLRRELAELVRFDESLACAQDWDFALRATALGVELGYVHEPLGVYHATATGARISEGDLVRPFLSWFDSAGPALTPKARHLFYLRALFLAHAQSSPLRAVRRLVRYTAAYSSGLPVTGQLIAAHALRRLKRLFPQPHRATPHRGCAE